MLSIVASLGFDERPVLKALLRHSSEGIRRVKVVMPINGEDSRATSAVLRLNEILTKLFDVRVEVIKVDPVDFLEAIRSLKKEMDKALEESKVLLVLGGGTRGIVVECLAAVLLLPYDKRRNVQVEIDLEFKEAYISLSAGDLSHADISPVEKGVLSTLIRNKEMGLSEIASILGLPRSTMWKIMKRLENLNLVRRMLVEGRIRYTLTMRGVLNTP